MYMYGSFARNIIPVFIETYKIMFYLCFGKTHVFIHHRYIIDLFLHGFKQTELCSESFF